MWSTYKVLLAEHRSPVFVVNSHCPRARFQTARCTEMGKVLEAGVLAVGRTGARRGSDVEAESVGFGHGVDVGALARSSAGLSAVP